MNSFFSLKHVRHGLLLLALFSSPFSLHSANFDVLTLSPTGDQPYTPLGPPTKIYGHSVLYADFNNDGINDEYKIYDRHSTISLSQGGQAFSNVYQIDESWALNDETLGSIEGIPTRIVSFDANNDGFEDIIAAFGSRIVLRTNDKNGGFADTQQFFSLSDLYEMEESLIPESLAQLTVLLFTFDINKDGYKDLVVLNINGLSIFLNDTMGNLYHLKNHNVTYQGTRPAVNTADLDVDSLPEIIINTSVSFVIYFSEDMSVKTIPIEHQSDFLWPIDIDNDGDLDLLELIYDAYGALQLSDPEFMTYWKNNGNGVFNKKVESTTDTSNTLTILDTSHEVPDTGSMSLQSLLLFIVLFITRTSRPKNYNTGKH